MTVKVICLDDANRPREIPRDKWIKRGEWYTLTFIAFCKPQLISGCSLYEKPLNEHCAPYEYFKLSRFGVRADDWKAFEKMCEEFTSLNGMDLEEVLQGNLAELPQRV